MAITLETVRMIGSEMTKLLRFRTYPVGINLYKSEENVPEGFEKIEQDLAICHYIGMARYHEKPIYATSDCTKSCAVGAKALGFGDFSDNWKENNVGRFAATMDAINKATGSINPFSLGEFKAFGISPLNQAPVVPDVVQVYGNPLKLLELVYSNTWNGGPTIKLETNGHGASCYEVLVIPYRTKEIRLAIADMGDRRYGFASDDEMIMGIPIEKLEELYKGLISTMGTINRYPVIYNFLPVPKHVRDKISGK